MITKNKTLKEIGISGIEKKEKTIVHKEGDEGRGCTSQQFLHNQAGMLARHLLHIEYLQYIGHASIYYLHINQKIYPHVNQEFNIRSKK